MKKFSAPATSLAIALLASLPASAFASEQDDAIRLCQDQISQIYAVNDFHHVWADQEGNHKFIVNGKVKYENQKYPFNCKVKNGQVKSYAYDGPHPNHPKDSNNVGKAVAVGVGLAIVAAIASQASKDDSSSKASLPVDQSILEDECHEALQYRMRDEHYQIRNIRLKSSRVDGHTLTGDGKAHMNDDPPSHFTYTCYFNNQGRIADSRYHLY